MVDIKISFLASEELFAKEESEKLVEKYGNSELVSADIIVALGGDGFMLRTLHETQDLGLTV